MLFRSDKDDMTEEADDEKKEVSEEADDDKENMKKEADDDDKEKMSEEADDEKKMDEEDDDEKKEVSESVRIKIRMPKTNIFESAGFNAKQQKQVAALFESFSSS